MDRFNNYKLVCLDVDGTLVNDSKEISDFTKEQIMRVNRDFGIKFLLVSSRMPKSLLTLMKSLDLDGPVVAYNGALILKNAAFTNSADVLQSVNLPADTLLVVHAAIQRVGKNAHLGVFSNNIWNVNELDYWALREARGTKIWPDVDEGLSHGESMIPLDHLHKVMVRAEKAVLDEIEGMLLSNLPTDCETFRSNDTFVEISPALALKNPAVSIIQSLLSVDAAGTIAFGDNMNDLDLLRSVGMGIAMSNAPIKVKQVCREITLSNNEDGIGYSLRKHFPY